MSLSLTPLTPGALSLTALAPGSLSLAVPAQGTVPLTADPTTISTALTCSEGLPNSSSLACGELGVALALLDPLAALTLTPDPPT